MTNKADLFLPEYNSLALPAGTMMVFVEGALCEDLEPVALVRAGWPEFSWAKLTYNPAARQDAQRRPLEQAEDRFAMARQITLRQLYNEAAPGVVIADLPLFVGQIEGMETRMGPDGETVELRARDASAVLERVTVYGRHTVDDDAQIVYLPGLDTVFNPGGDANAAAGPGSDDRDTAALFSASTEEAKPWSCAEAIHYLLTRYLPSGWLHRPGIDQLLALTEQRLARDLDVTGLSLLDALHRCCEAAALQFRFEPRLVETGPSQAIVFYRNGRGRTVELSCQPAGEALSLSRTNMAVLHTSRNFYPITHRYIGQGDFKVYEATFELVRAWNPALQGTNYDTFSASTNPEFHTVRDVYRKWCLNEAGDYAGQPCNQGEPYDFSKLFEGGAHVRHRRRFWPALSTDAQGKSLGYLLQASFDDGLHWWQYLHAFNNLLDECGIWLSSDQLDVDTWVAALKGVLRFRITASVVSDERLAVAVADGPVGSTVPVIDHVMTLPRRFRYRKVSAMSVLAQGDDGFGAPDEADDSAALFQFVRQRAASSAATIETTEVQTPSLALHCEPGDRVASHPQSRDLLSCRRDPRSLLWIDRVHMDVRKQCTRLKVVRQRTYEG